MMAYFIYSMSIHEENAIIRSAMKTKDELISKYEERDSIMRRVYMGADSAGTFVYRHIGDSVISYRSLLGMTDRLETELDEYKKKNRQLEDSLWTKNSVIKMLSEEVDFSYRVRKGNGELTVVLSFKGVK